MASLDRHSRTTDLGAHAQLPWRADCPICAYRLAGPAPSTQLVSQRVVAGAAAAAVATGTFGPAGTALAAPGASGNAPAIAPPGGKANEQAPTARPDGPPSGGGRAAPAPVEPDADAIVPPGPEPDVEAESEVDRDPGPPPTPAPRTTTEREAPAPPTPEPAPAQERSEPSSGSQDRSGGDRPPPRDNGAQERRERPAQGDQRPAGQSDGGRSEDRSRGERRDGGQNDDRPAPRRGEAQPGDGRPERSPSTSDRSPAPARSDPAPRQDERDTGAGAPGAGPSSQTPRDMPSLPPLIRDAAGTAHDAGAAGGLLQRLAVLATLAQSDEPRGGDRDLREQAESPQRAQAPTGGSGPASARDRQDPERSSDARGDDESAVERQKDGSPDKRAATHTVAAGDSLWTIAARHLGDSATDAEIAQRVSEMWDLNAQRIGSGDPDLIYPGQELRLS